MQVGLIVGKPSVGSRGLALAVVPTTSQDGEQVQACIMQQHGLCMQLFPVIEYTM
jgi:hypothetical protein